MGQFANITEGLRFRIVLEPGVALGPGKADLLAAIADTNSITAAASRFDMSYKGAGGLTGGRTRAFAERLVETTKGGTGGGGSARLTPLGRHVLERYRQMEADATAVIAPGIAGIRSHLD